MKRMNMKLIIASCFFTALVLFACNKDFLDKTPIGSLDESILNNKAGVDGLLIGAYSLLDGNGANVDDGNASVWNTWLGNVGSDDAHKGGGYSSQTERGEIENKTYSASNPILSSRWVAHLAGAQRANEVIRGLDRLPAGEYTEAEALQVRAEARFLRGIYHLELAKEFRNVPYVDETVTFSAGNYNVSNTISVWPKIEEDFQYAAANLAPTNAAVGRANSWAAKAFLAKTYMFQMKFTEAKTVLDDVIANGVNTKGQKYALLPEYSQLYRAIYDNGPETVFAVQMSVNDGAQGANGNTGEAFNYPNSTNDGGVVPIGGWGHQPSFTLVNAFKTANGFPMLDTFNNTDVKSNMGVASVDYKPDTTIPLDPRLDWTIARNGIPYHDWAIMNETYNPSGGPFRQKKNVHWKQDVGGVSSEIAGGWQQTNGTNYNLIRYADVLLWAAEAEVEVGSLQKAEEYVNIVRGRAANPAGFLKKYVNNADPSQGFSNTPAANYVINLYNGQFTANGKDFARKAVHFERRLELGLEGHRFFDLQRWDLAAPGSMANTLNAYMTHENDTWKKNAPFVPYLLFENGVTFKAGIDEIYAIPQSEIDKGGPTNALIQNPGHN